MSSRRTSILGFALLLFLSPALFAGISPARADNVTCTGTMTGVIKGNVVVPDGASCTLGSAYTGADVSGNVSVGHNASLLVAARQYPSTIAGNVQANQCTSALLDGAVTVGGNVEIAQCTQPSGFAGPGVKISGNFECHNNSGAGACQATLGQVSGNLHIHNNTSTAPANVSLTEVQGNLQCQNNSPAPVAAWGGNWVSGGMLDQCSPSVVAWPTAPPTCANLAALLAKVPYIISTATTNDNITYTPVASATVAAAGTHAGYCSVQFTYSAIGSPGSGAPVQSLAYGYGADTTPDVTGTTERQAIKIGVGLPLSAVDNGSGGVQGAWNGRLQSLGGGGLVGSVGSTTSATDGGYVGSSTDTGHTSSQNGTAEGGGNFGVTGTYSPANTTVPTTPNNILDVGKIDDYIIEGIHEQVEWTKLISRIYYGQKWAYNYWNGCSTGGRQGLDLAQNYGDEFDGLIVGAPAIFHDEFRLSDIWPYLVSEDDLVLAGQPTLTTNLWNATTAVVVAACQANNSFASSGATGYLDDPRACKASASLNICGASTANPLSCLTPQQAAAIDKIWAGPHNGFSNNGNRIFYPVSKGVTGGVVTFTAPTGFGGSTQQVMSWDHASTTISVNNLYESDQAVATYNPASGISYPNEALQGATGQPFGQPATQPSGLLPSGVGADDLTDTIVQNFGVTGVNLDLFKQHGGKMMMWQGTADQLIRYYDSVDFYRLVATRYGNGAADFAGLQSWFRYYHAPGGFHCSAGTGPAPTNIFAQLVGWVEQNASPDPVPTSGGNVNPNITPPLCPWPQSAYYNGSGATNLASSYHCAGNLDANTTAVCQMLRTPYRQETSNALNYTESGISPSQCPMPQ